MKRRTASNAGVCRQAPIPVDHSSVQFGFGIEKMYMLGPEHVAARPPRPPRQPNDDDDDDEKRRLLIENALKRVTEQKAKAQST
jgi:hypothetical protein